MTDQQGRRIARLCCLGLIAAGALGTWAVMSGWPMGNGSLSFPLSVGIGILGLSLLAPEDRQAAHPEDERPAARKGHRP